MYSFFDDLKSKIEYLKENKLLNEATIHDIIIRPILINPNLLGWDSLEVLSQQEIPISQDLVNSYVWQKSIPKKRRPDVLINPLGMGKSFAVIEEKIIQESLDKLNHLHIYPKYCKILMERQFLFFIIKLTT